MSSSFSYLPHFNKEFWEGEKKKLNIYPNDIKDLDKIFFKECHFFEEIDKNHKNEGEEFLKVYKELQNLALNLEKILPEKIPMLKKNTKDMRKFKRKEVALIFLLSFFNLIDMSQEKERDTNIFFVFNILLSLTKVKFEFGRCFLNYLTIIGKWLSENNPILEEEIKYIRDRNKLNIKKINKTIDFCEIQIFEKGSLFDGKTSYFVDFANEYIGGGVLRGACVQEEILFAVQPEAIISMFLMEVMSDEDAIRIDNTIRYSDYSGYAGTFKFEKCAFNDINNIKKNKIIAIDACISKYGFYGNIDKDEIKRDINKAYIGFNLVNFENEDKDEKTISTGNWGCGAFDGDHELKFLQQWIAASFAGIKRLDYYSFGEKEMDYISKRIDRIKEKYKNAYNLYKILKSEELKKGEVAKTLLHKKEDDCQII